MHIPPSPIDFFCFWLPEILITAHFVVYCLTRSIRAILKSGDHIIAWNRLCPQAITHGTDDTANLLVTQWAVLSVYVELEGRIRFELRMLSRLGESSMIGKSSVQRFEKRILESHCGLNW